MNTRSVILPVALLLGAAACEKDKTDSNDPFEVIRGAWEEAGLEVTELAEVTEGELPGVEGCRSGKVSGVHVLICEYPDAEAAEKGEEDGLERVGDGTGLSIARERMLLVLVDSEKVDPKGKTINKIGTTFRELDVPAPEEGGEGEAEAEGEKASAKPKGS